MCRSFSSSPKLKSFDNGGFTETDLIPIVLFDGVYPGLVVFTQGSVRTPDLEALVPYPSRPRGLRIEEPNVCDGDGHRRSPAGTHTDTGVEETFLLSG